MTGHFLAPATKLSQKLCNNFGHFFSPFKCSITSSNLSASPFPPGTWCLSGDSFLWKLFSNIWGFLAVYIKSPGAVGNPDLGWEAASANESLCGVSGRKACPFLRCSLDRVSLLPVLLGVSRNECSQPLSWVHIWLLAFSRDRSRSSH